MDGPFVIAADIGGTSFRVALINEDGSILSKKVEPTLPLQGYRNFIQRLKDTIVNTGSAVGFEKVRGIAIASAGPVDSERGMILTPPSLPTWRNVPLKASLEEEFHIPIWLESDADMAALGEHRFGAGQLLDRVIYITVSTGIGGGIIIGGQILRGSGVSLAEIGHMVVDPQGPVCNCGGKGHLEALASGSAIARMVVERITQGSASGLLKNVGGDLSGITAETVTKAALSGDTLANEVIKEAANHLGLAIVSLMHILDPQAVIVGGGVSNAGDLILDPIREVIAKQAMPDFKGRTKVVRSSFGDDSGLLGAAAFAFDKLNPEL